MDIQKDILLILLGAALGFGLTQLTEYIRRHVEHKDKGRQAKRIGLDVAREALQGIKRCKTLVALASQSPPQVSFSRVYTAFWDSVKHDLAKDLENREVLKLIHRIYYRFDLVNFNMERNALGVGAAFARSYLSEMIEDFETVIARLSTGER